MYVLCSEKVNRNVARDLADNLQGRSDGKSQVHALVDSLLTKRDNIEKMMESQNDKGDSIFGMISSKIANVANFMGKGKDQVVANMLLKGS